MNAIITNTTSRTRLLTAILLLFVPVLLSAQDKIGKKNGERITAHINNQEIQFKRWNNLNGPTETLSFDDIATIQYSTGKVYDSSKQEASASPQDASSIQASVEERETLSRPHKEAERQNNEQRSSEIQGPQINFSLNKRGEFYRQDSDKNYYVIEFEGMSKGALEARYKKSIAFYNQMPPFFEMPTFVLSSEKEIDATWSIYDWSINALNCRLTAKIDFKDGKMRINAPTLKLRYRQSIGDSFPDEFIAAEPRKSKEREDLCREIANTILNVVVLSMSSDLNLWGDYDISDERVSPEKQYFTLSPDGNFKFANGKNVMGFKIPGIKKERIREALNVLVNLNDRNNQPVLGVHPYPIVSKYDDDTSLQVNVIKDIELSQSLVGDILLGEMGVLGISFSYVYSCYDGEVLVSVPKVTTATYTSQIYEGPKEYLYKMGFVNLKGGFRKGAQDNINRINAYLNMIIMLPIAKIQDMAINPQKYRQDDDW